MSTHTPGPWHTGGTFFYGSEKRALQNVWSDPLTSGDQSGECIAEHCTIANARLIAAAPELLEALRLAHAEIHNPGAARYAGKDVDAIVSAAITKATT